MRRRAIGWRRPQTSTSDSWPTVAVRHAVGQARLLAQRRQPADHRIEFAGLDPPPEVRHRVLAQMHVHLRQAPPQARECVGQGLHQRERQRADAQFQRAGVGRRRQRRFQFVARDAQVHERGRAGGRETHAALATPAARDQRPRRKPASSDCSACVIADCVTCMRAAASVSEPSSSRCSSSMRSRSRSCAKRAGKAVVMS